MKRLWNEARKAILEAACRVAVIVFPGRCFANEAAPSGALFTHLRARLGGTSADVANEVEPDAALDAVIVSLGGETKAKEFWANAWQGLSMPHEVKSALDGIGASKHSHSLNAHASSKLAANATTKTNARGEGAMADDHADSYEWHDKAQQQHSAAAVNNPDMKELHERVRDWHVKQMSKHDECEDGCLTKSDANARQDQRNKLVTLVGENRMAIPQYGEAPAHVNAADHSKRLDGMADSLNDFLGKATHLKRSERANAAGIVEHTKRMAGFIRDPSNSIHASNERPGVVTALANAEASWNEVGKDLSEMVRGMFPGANGLTQPWIRDYEIPDAGGVWGAIVQSPAGKLYRVRFTLKDGEPVLEVKLPEEVEVETRYVSITADNPNEGKTVANEGATSEQVSFVNEIKVDGNWVQLSPYGDFAHTGGTQRFTKMDAENIVNEFGSLLNTAQRVMGIPFYIGHPDHPEFKQRYTDTKAYGRIKQMEAREDGLWGNVKWSAAGKTMVNEEQFHGHSVNWRVRKDKDGFWRPFSVKSVGFTNEPNIPVQPITHANEVQDGDVENDLLAAAR